MPKHGQSQQVTKHHMHYFGPNAMLVTIDYARSRNHVLDIVHCFAMAYHLDYRRLRKIHLLHQ